MAKKAAAEKIEFNYEGTNRGGTKVKGEIYALSDALAKNELRKQGINPLKVKKKPKPLLGGAQKINPSDIAIFARQMATMMHAGVPLVQSFEIIGQGSDNKSMQKLIFAIKADVEGGVPLAEALSKHPLYFDPLFINLIAAGEQSGALETMLDKLATYKEKTEALKAKVKKALFYPDCGINHSIYSYRHFIGIRRAAIRGFIRFFWGRFARSNPDGYQPVKIYAGLVVGNCGRYRWHHNPVFTHKENLAEIAGKRRSYRIESTGDWRNHHQIGHRPFLTNT